MPALSPVQQLHGMKCAQHKKASKIPVPQAVMKLRQTPIGPDLPRTKEILPSHPTGPHIPGQQVQVPIDLQKICKAFITAKDSS